MAAETVLTLSDPDAVETSVKIWATKIDHNLDKPIINIPIPRQKAAMDAGTAPTTYLIDIGRVSEVIAVIGSLIDESTGAATTDSAQIKKDNFLTIVRKKRFMTLTWGTGSRQQSYSGNISKVVFTETPGIIGVQSSGYESEKNFAIQFSLMVGSEK